jgi:hypothetical protein
MADQTINIRLEPQHRHFGAGSEIYQTAQLLTSTISRYLLLLGWRRIKTDQNPIESKTAVYSHTPPYRSAAVVRGLPPARMRGRRVSATLHKRLASGPDKPAGPVPKNPASSHSSRGSPTPEMTRPASCPCLAHPCKYVTARPLPPLPPLPSPPVP